MNPAEGELRPQLSDRIGLHISVHSIMDLEDRVKIMERREDFERDPSAFKERFREEQNSTLENIVIARELLKKVKVSRDMMGLIAYVCMEMGVDGHRADIAILKTSKTIAAYNGLEEVNQDHVEEAALLVLGERFNKSQNRNKINQMIQKALDDLSKKKEKEEQQKTEEQQDQSGDHGGQDQGNGNREEQQNKQRNEDNQEAMDSEEKDQQTQGQQLNSGERGSQDNENSDTKEKGKKLKAVEKEEDVYASEEGLDIKKLLKIKGKKKRKLYGKRVDSTTQKGKYVKSSLPKDMKNDVAIDATLRAAAMSSEGTINVKSEDLRHKVRKHGAKASIAIVVDISGSMFSEKKAERVKDILISVIEDAGRQGDKISVVGFKGKEATVIIPTTKESNLF